MNKFKVILKASSATIYAVKASIEYGGVLAFYGENDTCLSAFADGEWRRFELESHDYSADLMYETMADMD